MHYNTLVYVLTSGLNTQLREKLKISLHIRDLRHLLDLQFMFKSRLIVSVLIVSIVSISTSPLVWAAATLVPLTESGNLFSTVAAVQRRGQFMHRIAVGDLNDDGITDFALTNVSDPATNKGSIYVFFGTAGGVLPNDPDLTVSGTINAQSRGSSIAIGDVNNDGIVDLVEAQITTNGTGYGVVNIFFGRTNFSITTPDVVLQSSFTADFFLTATIGDLNNDDIADIVASTSTTEYNPTAESRVLAYYGPITTSKSPDVNIIYGTYYGNFYQAVMDINNDSYNDLVIGSGGDATAGSYAGAFSYYAGSALGISPIKTYLLYGSNANALFGNYTNVLKNVPYQGVDSIAVPNETYSTNKGRVFVFTPTTNVSGSDATEYIGENTSDNFGRMTGSIGDLDNDGYSEFAIGSWGYLSGTSKGQVQVYKGGATLPASHTWTLTGQSAGDRYTIPLETGDYNSNDWADFTVYAYGYPAGSSKGNLYMYEISHGSPAITTNPLATVTSKEVTGTATDTVNVGGVEWSTSNSILGTWASCSAEDSAYDSTSEDFVCDVSSLSDGTYTLYFRSYDLNTVLMPQALYASRSVQIQSDATGPENGTISINNGAIYTTSEAVTLTISAEDAISSVTEMQISNYADFNDGVWEAYDTSKSWTLLSGNGTKTVYIKFKDSVGNISATFSDSISTDKSKPELVKIGIVQNKLKEIGQETIYSKNSKLKVFMDVSSDINQYRISTKDNFDDVEWENYDGDFWHKFASKDGRHKLYLQFKDLAGNESKIYSQTFRVDRSAPKLKVLKLNSKEVDLKRVLTSGTNITLEGYTEEKASLMISANGLLVSQIDSVDRDKKYRCEKKVFNDLKENKNQNICYWSLKIKDLAKGTRQLTVYSKDKTGNSSEVKFNLEVR